MLPQRLRDLGHSGVSKVKIAQVAPLYSPVIGGVENVVRKIAEYTASLGHDAAVVTYNRLREGGEGSLPKKQKISGVEVRRVSADFTWSHGAYGSEIKDELRNLEPDVVHVHCWRHPHVFQVARIKNELSARIILHGHSNFHRISQLRFMTWLYHRFVDFWLGSYLRRYDLVIALTPHERNILSDGFGVESDRIAVVPNGIDAKKLTRKSSNDFSDSPFVFYLGRISKSKNLDLLIRSMRYVQDKIEADLVLAGPDEDYAKRIENLADKEGISFQYKGIISEEKKLDLYESCRLFAHPPLYEPFGITLLEAQAFGNPCVITGSGGQLYAAPPGKTSLLAKMKPESFGRAILSLLRDEKLYKRLSESAVEWSSKHDWSNILPIYERIYEGLAP